MAPGSAGVSLGERARESAITTLDKANEPEEHDRYDVVVAQRNTVLAVMTFSSLGGLTDVAVHRLPIPARNIILSAGELL
jgi:hypothetical protein